MNTFRSYADYEIPLLRILSDLPGGQGTSKAVRDSFGERFADRIPDEHRVYLDGAHEAKWRNIVAWVRNTLIGRGLMDSPAYGIWRITDAGRAYLAQAGDSAPLVGPSLATQLVQAPDRTVTFPSEKTAAENPQGELIKAAFIERTRTALEHLLADSGQAVTLSVHRDRLVQVHFPGFSGCHYELWVHANSIELGLHFESSQRLNFARLEAFLPHQDALTHALGEQLRFENWGENAARVFYELLKAPLTPALAVDHAARLHRLITETLPILREAFASKADRPRIEARIEPPTRVHAIIDTHTATIRDFLKGRADRPSDERLCDWIHLCYELELYREGRDLFALVDPSQVNPWYYERTRRLAKVCAMKVTGQA